MLSMTEDLFEAKDGMMSYSSPAVQLLLLRQHPLTLAKGMTGRTACKRALQQPWSSQESRNCSLGRRVLTLTHSSEARRDILRQHAESALSKSGLPGVACSCTVPIDKEKVLFAEWRYFLVICSCMPRLITRHQPIKLSQDQAQHAGISGIALHNLQCTMRLIEKPAQRRGKTTALSRQSANHTCILPSRD